MAVTGVVWIGFLSRHMWGNLHIFQGPEAFNHYAEFLRTVGEPGLLLWPVAVAAARRDRHSILSACLGSLVALSASAACARATMPSNGSYRPTMRRALCASAAW